MKKKVVVGYCKESSVNQADMDTSVDQQEKKLRCYADLYMEDYELLIFKEVSEDVCNGYHPMLEELIVKIENDDVSCVLVCQLELLMKDVIKLNQVLQLCKEHDTRFISLLEKIDTELPTGEVLNEVASMLANWKLYEDED